MKDYLHAVGFFEDEWHMLSASEKERIQENYELYAQDPAYRHVFFPALCRWVASQGGSLHDWHAFLVKHGLMAQDDITAVMNVNQETQVYYQEALVRSLCDYMWYERTEPEYQSVVLLRAVALR